MQDFIEFDVYFKANYMITENNKVKSRYNNRYFDAATVLTEYINHVQSKKLTTDIDLDYVIRYIRSQSLARIDVPKIYISLEPTEHSISLAQLIANLHLHT